MKSQSLPAGEICYDYIEANGVIREEGEERTKEIDSPEIVAMTIKLQVALNESRCYVFTDVCSNAC